MAIGSGTKTDDRRRPACPAAGSVRVVPDERPRLEVGGVNASLYSPGRLPVSPAADPRASPGMFGSGMRTS